MTEDEKVKKIAEISRKLDNAIRELETKQEFLKKDIYFNRDTAMSEIDVKYAAQRVESLQRELDRLK